MTEPTLQEAADMRADMRAQARPGRADGEARPASGGTGGRSRSRKAIMVVHIIASVALLGEVWALVVLNLLATLTEDLGLAHAAYRLMPALVFAGGIPLSLIALVTGVVLSVRGPWGLVRHYWVFAKLLLLIATMLVGMLLFDPEGLATATEGTARPVARQWGQVAAPATQLVMLLTAATLSVFKPRGRITWRPPRRASPPAT